MATGRSCNSREHLNKIFGMQATISSAPAAAAGSCVQTEGPAALDVKDGEASATVSKSVGEFTINVKESNKGFPYPVIL